jgi:malonyl-CoA/methylmalonyl-CoA synthetase
MGVPTYYTRLLDEDRFAADICTNMRLFISGSAPLLKETFDEFRSRTGHAIVERYGMSETNMNTSNPLHGERRAGTVGPPLPGVEVRVVDEQGESLPAGETGDLQVRGSNVFQGYWRMPEKTREDFTEDGFFNTGDKATISADGYVAIVGRAKDLIICGGLNVYPKEVEQLLDDLEGVVEPSLYLRRAIHWTSRPSLISARGKLLTSRCPSRYSLSTNCPATPWARCRKTCCVSATAQANNSPSIKGTEVARQMTIQ